MSKKPYKKPTVRSTPVPEGSKLVVWSAEWCAPCKAMKKAGTALALATKNSHLSAIGALDQLETKP